MNGNRQVARHVSAPSAAMTGMTYGVTASGLLAHVGSVPRGLACDCFCIGCGMWLQAKKGMVKDHHFAHAPLDGGTTPDTTACWESYQSALIAMAMAGRLVGLTRREPAGAEDNADDDSVLLGTFSVMEKGSPYLYPIRVDKSGLHFAAADVLPEGYRSGYNPQPRWFWGRAAATPSLTICPDGVASIDDVAVLVRAIEAHGLNVDRQAIARSLLWTVSVSDLEARQIGIAATAGDATLVTPPDILMTASGRVVGLSIDDGLWRPQSVSLATDAAGCDVLDATVFCELSDISLLGLHKRSLLLGDGEAIQCDPDALADRLHAKLWTVQWRFNAKWRTVALKAASCLTAAACYEMRKSLTSKPIARRCPPTQSQALREIIRRVQDDDDQFYMDGMVESLALNRGSHADQPDRPSFVPRLYADPNALDAAIDSPSWRMVFQVPPSVILSLVMPSIETGVIMMLGGGAILIGMRMRRPQNASASRPGSKRGSVSSKLRMRPLSSPPRHRWSRITTRTAKSCRSLWRGRAWCCIQKFSPIRPCRVPCRVASYLRKR